MRLRFTMLIVLFLVGAVYPACESDDTDRDGEIETTCVTSLDQIDFGGVAVGEFRDTCTTIEVAEVGGHIADTIVIDCPDFRFVDTLSGEISDTLIYDLTWPDDTTLCIRFEPQEIVPTICSVDRGSDCGDLGLSGFGALPGYEMYVFEFPSEIDLYDVELSLDAGGIVCGDSGTVAVSMSFMEWLEPCDGPLTTAPLRDMELVNVGGLMATVVFVGGGGGSNGLMFVECDPAFTYEEIEYFNSSLVLADGQFAWLVGRGHDLVNGYNGVHFTASEPDSFTLHRPSSEITCIDGSTPSDVWAVLNEPSNSLYHFDGETWEPRTEGWMTASLQHIWVHESGEAFAVGSNGAIYHYTGSVWEDQSIEFENGTLYGVFGFTATDVFAVGEGMAVYYYDGEVWGPLPTPPGRTETLYAVHALDAGDLAKVVVAVGEKGSVIGYAKVVIPPSIGSGALPGGAPGVFGMMKQ